MKKLLLMALTTAFLLPASSEAQRRPRDRPRDMQKACSCYELERRLNGLNTVLRSVRLDRREERQISRDYRQGYRYYQQVNFRRDSRGEQERVCSLGNQAVDRSWVRWQPWLARRGWDQGNPCGLAEVMELE
ncbi:MAG TPA: hypothetical protein VFV50_13585 [Bdellovibrionales bacterium]|nr:hypothetical protein [Bdellovibrionales bacterium]